MLYYKKKIGINVFNLVNENCGLHNIYIYEERVVEKTADEICTLIVDYFSNNPSLI